MRSEEIPRSVVLCYVLVTVFAILIVFLFCTLTNELEKQVGKLETRFEYLEDRVGRLSIAKSKTGMNRVWRVKGEKK